MQGSTQAARETTLDGNYVGGGDPGPHGGGTYTGTETHNDIVQQYENVFGPAARDIKFDTQRSKRHQRWHLPDALQGPNMWLTDRIDGLITDATNSPFTTAILPYQYVENPDAKLKWNVWSFDEGMASRVPYESAARVLTQSKRSFSAYTVRQGLAIAMEHNFMKSAKGIENFQNQIKQMVGSIQYTNDLDVHMALIQAPSYAKTLAEKYHSPNKTPQQLIRQYVDLFGIVQKNPNAMDLLIEEAKQCMRNWGSQEPTFMLCNGKLSMQLTMSPEKTSYITQGIDGIKRLRTGPDLASYRGVNIIKSRAFSMETNTQPRDVMRRRVRVAEYYWIPKTESSHDQIYQFYDEGRDSWVSFSWKHLEKMASKAPVSTGRDFRRRGVEHREDNGVDNYDGGARDPKVVEAARDAAEERQRADQARGRPTAQNSSSNPYNAGANVSLTLDNWNQSPYSLKIGLLSSLGGVHIGDGKSGLHCATSYSTDEAAFVKVAQAATNFIDVNSMQESMDSFVQSSAWIGAGLFNDTTYHFAFGNSYDTPLSNWAALDIEKHLCRDMSNGPEYLFAFEEQSFETISNRLPSEHAHLKLFMPYQPNNFKMCVTEKAHTAQNASNLTKHSRENVAAAATAHAYLSKDVLQYLMQDVTKSKDLVDHMYACHAFITPGRTKLDTHTEEQDTREHLRKSIRNPYRTRVLQALMACVHPDQNVRNKAKGLCVGMDKDANDFFAEVESMESDAITGSIMGNAMPKRAVTAKPDISFMNPVSPNQNHSITMDWNHVSTLDREQKSTIFYLTLCKRIFCGAPRFDMENAAENYKVSLLSRCYPTVTFGPLVKGGEEDMSGGGEDTSGGETSAADGEGSLQGLLLVRPNIEHEMLGIVLGRGGTGELGATLWGQTELSCFDDSQHGIWGMSYKYHERAQVFNERNMVRTWDIAFDGYNGGMGSQILDARNQEDVLSFMNATQNTSEPYDGKDFVVIPCHGKKGSGGPPLQLPNPIVWYESGDSNTESSQLYTDPEQIHTVHTKNMRLGEYFHTDHLKRHWNIFECFRDANRLQKVAGAASAENQTCCYGSLAFQGSMRVCTSQGSTIHETHGSGHLGPSYVGVASIRDGKGLVVNKETSLHRLV
jgi:hypothetical protein